MANVDVRQDNQPVISAETPDGRFTAGEAARRSVELERRVKRQFMLHLVVGGLLSVGWLFFTLYYAVDRIGVFEFFKLPLHEAAVLVLAIVVPIILIWLILAFIRRDRELRAHRLALEARLDLLTYPDTAAGERVREVTTALQRQTEELSRASLSAVERLRDADELLRQRSNQLWQASDGARGRAETMAREIAEKSALLEASVNGISVKGDEISSMLKVHSDRLEDSVQEGVGRVQEIVDAFQDKLGDIGELADRATDTASARAKELQQDILAQLSALTQSVDQAASQVESTSQSVGAAIREEMARATSEADDHANGLYRAIETIHEKAAGLATGFGGDVDRVVGEIDRVAVKAGEIDQQLREHLNLFNQTIQSAEEKSGQISQRLRDDGQALNDAATAAIDKAENASGQLHERLRSLTEATETFTRHSETAQQTAAATQSTISDVGEKFAEQTRNLESAVSGTVADVGDFITEKTRSLEQAVGATLAEVGSKFSDQTRSLEASFGATLEEAGDKFEVQTRALESTVAKTVGTLSEAGDTAQSHAQALDTAITGASRHAGDFGGQVETLANRLTEMSEIFSGQTGSVNEKTVELLDRMAEQNEIMDERVTRLTAASGLAKAEANALEDAFVHHINLLEDAATRAATTGDGIGKNLEARTAELNQVLSAITAIDANISEGVDRLKQDAAKIADATTTTDAQLSGILERFEKGRNEAFAAGDLAAGIYDKVNAALQTNTVNLLSAADEAKSLVDQFDALTTNLEARMKGLSDSVEEPIQRLQSAEKSFADGIAIAGGAVGRESERIDRLREKLAASSQQMDGQAGLLNEAGKQIANSLAEVTNGMSDHFAGVEGRAQAVKNSIDQMLGRLESRAKELDEAATHSSEVARLVTQAFRKQAQELIAASDQAAAKTEDLYDRHAQARRGAFIRDMSFITESLHGRSVDISLAIEQNVPEDAWARYQAGDRGIFTRTLLKRQDNFSLMAIKSQFHEDSEFREHVNRYLKLFEEAVEQAEQNDPEEVLSSTLLSSDVGKLYLLLSRALERIR